MQSIFDAITEWLKGLLVEGIMGNLGGLFTGVNEQVGEIAAQVGMTPAAWNAGVFSMIRQLSETVILPIAGLVLTFVMTYELIQMPKNQFEVLLTDGYMELGVTKGTPIKITNSGEEIECIVSGFFDKSFVGTENGTDAIDPANLIITQELAQQLFPNTENFAYSWEIITDKTYNDEIESAIQQKITSKEKGLSICSYNDVVEYMESSMNLLFGSLQMLSLLILLFGIINLINMTLSNHQARKQEISTLRTVGLSLKQLYHSLITEGLLYVLVSFGIVLLVGIPIAIPVSKAVGILFGMPNLSYQFPTMQIGGYLLILILLQLILSVWEIRDLKKCSLTEQMRAME